MAPLFVIFLTITLVSAHGFALGMVSSHMQCDSDHQCDVGFFCYDESHLCTRCVECRSYNRKSSPPWRSCPKTPSECGACLPEHEEDILHEGGTRDMCVLSLPNNLSHTIVPEYSFVERILWAGGVTVLILPIIYYVFSRKNRIRDRGALHSNLHREEPPPYRSIELTTLSGNNSEERMAEEDHVLCVGQQKDHLVQAVPFQKPAYMEEELVAFGNAQDSNSEEPQYLSDEVAVPAVSSVELHDENTMPSDWTPDENSNNGQMLSFELPVSSDSDERCECEPVAKRHKTSESQESNDDESTNTHNLSINLFINNNFTIHKPY